MEISPKFHFFGFFAAAFSSFLLGLVSLSATAQQGRDSQIDEASYVMERISDGSIKAAIAGLGKIAPSERVEKFAVFAPHVSDATIIDENPEAIVPANEILDSHARSIITQALQPIVNANGSAQTLDSEFYKIAERNQCWAVLYSFELSRDYRAEYLLAESLLKTEGPGVDADLLHLIAARTAWMYWSINPPKYSANMEAAGSSQNQVIANQAHLWQEAVNSPASLDALKLTLNLCLVNFREMNYRERGETLTRIINRSAIPIYETIKNGEPSADRDAKLSRVAAIAAYGGYIQSNITILDWAVNSTADIKTSNANDQFSPRYFRAYYYLALGDREKAIVQFEDLLLSGVNCEINCESGIRLCEAFSEKSDLDGARAVLQMALELYPDQQVVIADIRSEIAKIEFEKPTAHPEDIAKYIGAHYQTRFTQSMAKVKAARANIVQANPESNVQ